MIIKLKNKLNTLVKSLIGKANSKLDDQHRLKLLIAGSVIIGLSLTMFSLSLYFITGSSKLDLSRPGYEAVRNKVSNPRSNDGYSFSPKSKLNKKTIKDFMDNYNKQLDTTRSYDGYDSKIMDDATLGLVE